MILRFLLVFISIAYLCTLKSDILHKSCLSHFGIIIEYCEAFFVRRSGIKIVN